MDYAFGGMNTEAGASPGFSVVSAVLGARECDELIAALPSASVAGRRAGARGLLALPAIAALAEDPRLLAIAASFVGHAARPFRATLFDKSAAANWLVPWHQDTALPLARRFDADGWSAWSVKAGILHANAPTAALRQVVALRVHLDDATPDNGPLRVLPGSHARGVLSGDEVAVLARDTPATTCVVARGGILAMRPLLVHASSKAQSPRRRRVLHLEYAAALALDDGAEIAVA